MKVVVALAGMLVCVSVNAQTSKMAFVGFGPTGGGLYVTDIGSSSKPDLITEGLEAFDEDSINSEEFDWSPDGKRIVFVHKDLMGPTDIYVVNSDGTNLREVVRQSRMAPGYGRNPDSVAVSSGAFYWPVWSPDGSRIAFVAGTIHVVNPDGTGFQDLDIDAGSHLNWLPDGQFVYGVTPGY